MQGKGGRETLKDVQSDGAVSPTPPKRGGGGGRGRGATQAGFCCARCIPASALSPAWKLRDGGLFTCPDVLNDQSALQ